MQRWREIHMAMMMLILMMVNVTFGSAQGQRMRFYPNAPLIGIQECLDNHNVRARENGSRFSWAGGFPGTLGEERPQGTLICVDNRCPCLQSLLFRHYEQVAPRHDTRPLTGFLYGRGPAVFGGKIRLIHCGFLNWHTGLWREGRCPVAILENPMSGSSIFPSTPLSMTETLATEWHSTRNSFSSTWHSRHHMSATYLSWP